MATRTKIKSSVTQYMLTEYERLAILGALDNQKRIKGAEKKLTSQKEKDITKRAKIERSYDVVLRAIDSAINKLEVVS